MGKTDTFSTVLSTAIMVISIFIRSSKYDSFRTFQSTSFPPSGILRTYNGFSPVDLICLTDRVSRSAIANVRLRFPVNPEFFKVFFNFNFEGAIQTPFSTA